MEIKMARLVGVALMGAFGYMVIRDIFKDVKR